MEHQEEFAPQTSQASALTVTDSPFIRIRPRKGLLLGELLREVWNYRDLFYFLVWRDILVRYKQTFLGVAWAVVQPLAAMVVFTVFFGRLAKIPSDGLPYAVFSYSALLLWTFFAHGLTFSANSLILNERLVTKIYFPRVIMPVAPILSCLLDLAIGCLLLFFLLPYYAVGASHNIWALPLMVLLAMIVATGAGLWLSALNVKYRDFKYVIPFLSQIWMFASPVVYPTSLVPEKWRAFMGLNPMAGAIEGFRWALLGTGPFPFALIGTSVVVALIILATGLFYFRTAEESFADLI